MKFKDLGAIKLGELAFEIGDYTCALAHLFKAYNKLKEYQGDKFEMNSLMGNLSFKLKESIGRQGDGKSILLYETWKLSKSSFVRGKQCDKSLFLDKFNKMDRNPISTETQALFNRGHEFEDFVRENRFPGGTNVKEKVGNFFYFNSYTKYLMEDSTTNVIYEASIIEDEVLVMCDILVKNEDGKIDVFEIKLNSEINDAIKSDLAIQYTICKKRFGEQLNSFNLILRSNEKDQPYKIIDVTEDVSKLTHEVETQIDHFKNVLTNQEPTISMGSHCAKPYACDFTNYCRARIS
jgi:hypothetical protein